MKDPLFGEVLQRRDADQLTDDHPLRPYPERQPWRTSVWLRAAFFLAVSLVTVAVAALIYVIVTGAINTITTGYTAPLLQLVTAIIAYVVLTFVMEARVWPIEIAPRRLLDLLRGMALGALIIAVCVGFLALIGVYRVEAIYWEYNPLAAFVSYGLVAAVSEEILFRGVGFRLVEEGLGTWAAVAISGLVFGLSHLGNQYATVWGAIAIAIEGGILLAGVYALTRSLWWCIGVHFAWNIVQGPVFGSIVSGAGLNDSWLVSSWTGPEILTGGTFGLEASIVPVVLAGTLGVILLVIAHRRGLIIDPIWVRKRRLLAQTAAPHEV